MSRNKKASFWQRLKHLITAKVARSAKFNVASRSDRNDADSHYRAHDEDSAPSRNKPPLDVPAHTPAAHTVAAHKSAVDSVPEQDTNSRSQTSEQKQQKTGQNTEDKSVRLVSLANLDVADSTSTQPHHQGGHSDKPITDSILAYLEASELSYYYHDPADHAPADSKAKMDTEQSDRQQTSEEGEIVRNVQHISMAMRYYADQQSSPPTSEQADSEHSDTQQQDEVEWGCVIRIHEHTQLVAIYGVLPFQLPPSHLQAGLTLAAQLNYDMMLGCVEIDIRDGEIRFKNSLDFEPIIESHQGEIPEVVISYLLKGVMAMTASFAPIFSDLIDSDPKTFELATLLDKRWQEQIDSNFFLATTTPQ